MKIAYCVDSNATWSPTHLGAASCFHPRASSWRLSPSAGPPAGRIAGSCRPSCPEPCPSAAGPASLEWNARCRGSPRAPSRSAGRLCPIHNPRSQRTDCRRTDPLPCFLRSWRRQYISEHFYNIQFFTTRSCLRV